MTKQEDQATFKAACKTKQQKIWLCKKEVWVDVVHYEGIYEVSSHGRIRSRTRRFIPIGHKTSKLHKGRDRALSLRDGYNRIGLTSVYGKVKIHSVHRLVAESFLGLPKNKLRILVNHIDEVRDNNRLDNLEWVTPSENVLHSIKR